ncbi:MAG: LEA type 2 family protein [Pseudomonadota bacterium]|nr:LEA type 2 family protein [Pseudomonadota bacterium]
MVARDNRLSAPFAPLHPSRRAIAIAVLACGMLCGCAGVITRPLPPKVDVQGMQTVVLPGGETRFRVRLNVHNPNAYDVAVQAIEATIRIEEQPIATADLPQPVVLRGDSDTQVDVDARPDFSALAGAFDRVLRRFKAAYQVTGYAVIQDGMRLNFDKRGELPLADLLGKLR